MRLGLYSITPAQMEALMSEHLDLSPADRLTLASAGGVSAELLAGFFDRDFLCFIGLVPITILSDTAHLWMYHTPAVDRHRVMVARHSRRFVARALDQWPTLVGYCGDFRSALWLRWLGAEFDPHPQGLRPFTIKRPA